MEKIIVGIIVKIEARAEKQFVKRDSIPFQAFFDQFGDLTGIENSKDYIKIYDIIK